MGSVHRQPLFLSNQYWTESKQSKLKRKLKKNEIGFADHLKWHTYVDKVFSALHQRRYESVDGGANRYAVWDKVEERYVSLDFIDREHNLIKMITSEYNLEHRTYLNLVMDYLLRYEEAVQS
jgi:hypothetical protein